MLCCKWSLLCGSLLAAAIVGFLRPCHDELDLTPEESVATQMVVSFDRLPTDVKEKLFEEAVGCSFTLEVLEAPQSTECEKSQASQPDFYRDGGMYLPSGARFQSIQDFDAMQGAEAGRAATLAR